MHYTLVAAIAYLLGGFTVVLDKFLLGSKRISSAPIYAFYVGLTGMFVLAFVPFGFFVPTREQIILSLFSGMLFDWGILALYFSIQRSQASQVTPVVGAVTPIATYVASFVLLGERLTSWQSMGVALLIVGGLIISIDFRKTGREIKMFSGFTFALVAGVLFALAYTLFKDVYRSQPFLNGFIWTRFGSFVAALTLLIVPVWRRGILNSLKKFHRPKKSNVNSGALFSVNKILGGTSSILINFALSLGSATVVNSLVSLQYVFVLVLASAAQRRFPDVFQERVAVADWVQKVSAIVLITGGVALVSL